MDIPLDELEISEEPEIIESSKYNELFDRYQRSLAEFDNFRKRTIKEKASMYDDGQRDVATKILPIIDNFDRALKSADNKDDVFYQGIAMIAKQFKQILQDIGISTIETEIGGNFNVHEHFAVAHIEDENIGQNKIAEVLQEGYKHKDKVLRPSMVKVAN